VLRVGLTGGVACGKSTVAKMFADLGAELIDADKIVHELYRKGQPVYWEILNHFGTEILTADDEIDRLRLAAVVFEGGRVQELNRIVHPAVARSQRAWMDEIGAKNPDAIAIVEATLILEARAKQEAGTKERFDKIIVVTCRPEQKISRYAKRTVVSESAARAEVERRTKVQMSDEEKVALADYVIDNSGPLEATHAQVKKIFSELKVLSR
jgi:dephospho-CoA kinase